MPAGVRAFLAPHEVRTILEMNWSPTIKNGDLPDAAEVAGFEVLLTSDQNIRHQQNLAGRKLALVVLGSNIWNVVGKHRSAITDAIDRAAAGSYELIPMPIPRNPLKAAKP